MRELSDSEHVANEPCPDCGSRDNLGRYDDGHGYCFGCGYYEHGEGENKAVEHRHNTALVRGEYRPIKTRGLHADTLRKFDYRLAGQYHYATFYNAAGKAVAQKRRGSMKTFAWVGDNRTAVLFGQQVWQPGGRKVVVTEGELDAMSLSQVQGNKWPVVSVKDGAGSAAKSVRDSIEWLCSFSEVVFMFDSDEPGVEAALECAELLPPGKAHIATLPLKDANAMLVDHREEQLVDCMWRAKPYRPDGIVSGSELWDILQQPDPVREAAYPYTILDRNLNGLRRSEVVTVCAGTGVGKSTFMREVAYSLIQQGHKVGYIALEETVKHTAKALMSIHLNQPLHLRPLEMDDPKYKEAYDATVGSDQVCFYDHWGSTASETLLNKIRFMAVGLGCQWVVLDHISIVVSGDDSRDSERILLDRAMTNLGSLSRELHIGVLVVCHLRKADGKPFEEGGQISLNHLRGTAGIAQLSNAVIAIERDQQDDEDTKATVRVLKDRFTGFTGLSGEIVYDKTTGRLEDVDPFREQEQREARRDAPDAPREGDF